MEATATAAATDRIARPCPPEPPGWSGHGTQQRAPQDDALIVVVKLVVAIVDIGPAFRQGFP